MYMSNNGKVFVLSKDESMSDLPSFDKFITHCVITNFKNGGKRIEGFSSEEHAQLEYDARQQDLDMLNNCMHQSIVMQEL